MSDWLVDGKRIVDWRRAIGELILLHQHIRELDHARIWANELPRVAAKPDDVARVERELGCAIDPRFKTFLLCADGWRAFYQWVDLFGTEDLLGDPMRTAAGQLAALDRGEVLARAGFSTADLLPIAMTRPGQGTETPDLFTVVQRNHKHSGQVIWLLNEEIDRFRDFDAFYLTMLDYNREEIKELVAEAERQGRVM